MANPNSNTVDLRRGVQVGRYRLISRVTQILIYFCLSAWVFTADVAMARECTTKHDIRVSIGGVSVIIPRDANALIGGRYLQRPTSRSLTICDVSPTHAPPLATQIRFNTSRLGNPILSSLLRSNNILDIMITATENYAPYDIDFQQLVQSFEEIDQNSLVIAATGLAKITPPRSPEQTWYKGKRREGAVVGINPGSDFYMKCSRAWACKYFWWISPNLSVTAHSGYLTELPENPSTIIRNLSDGLSTLGFK